MNNRIGPDESAVVNPNTARSQTLFEHFRKRKFIWAIFFIIFIVASIVIPTIIVTENKTKREGTSTMEKITATAAAEITTAMTTEIATAVTTGVVTEITTLTIAATTTTTTTSEQLTPSIIISSKTKWKQNAVTVAGGNGPGNQLNQLNQPRGIHVDDDSIYIADTDNHRVVRWEFSADKGEIVAGGTGPGHELYQLNFPLDVVLDKEKKYIIICDHRNVRVVQWSLQNSQNQQELIKIVCSGLAMDNNGDLYISDWSEHKVIRWQQGDKQGTIVAGGHGKGNQLNQLNQPNYIFVDEHHSVYVADGTNNRVVKWMKNATGGTLIAPWANSNSMYGPISVIVNHIGNVYVSTQKSHRIKRWSRGALDGPTIVGENEGGSGPTQLGYPSDLSFDRHGNLYVVDYRNSRIQKFVIDLD
ncbi:unnamed protein product [Adineta steineri]|uniref:Uncharacterized protein n=1 Tax=Adineta steineri TaxID=433720 RepID=A0A814SUT1_9BILA|nr:unnamed protein product [Adineta steineri]CAF1341004.1 unnamed protein product [Adineta steineri]CAF1356728.1 unnamed protein product [Adineta steineri]